MNQRFELLENVTTLGVNPFEFELSFGAASTARSTASDLFKEADLGDLWVDLTGSQLSVKFRSSCAEIGLAADKNRADVSRNRIMCDA
jgi:hypothetical protein